MQSEPEQDYALRLACEHRVLSEHYRLDSPEQYRDHRDKAEAWEAYAQLCAEGFGIAH